MSDVYEAFAVISDESEGLSIASTDGQQLAIYTSQPAALEEMRASSEIVVKVSILTSGALRSLKGVTDSLQEEIATREAERDIALEHVAELKKTIQNALSELKAGDVQSAIDQLEAGNE